MNDRLVIYLEIGAAPRDVYRYFDYNHPVREVVAPAKTKRRMQRAMAKHTTTLKKKFPHLPYYLLDVVPRADFATDMTNRVTSYKD